MVSDELSYDRSQLASEHLTYISTMTDEQRIVYDSVMERALMDIGGVFFVYGYGGTGKTFIWNTLSAGLRSR